MRSFDRRRTIILLVAVLLPSSVLVGLALRLMRQEHELAQRRLVQTRRARIAQLGLELERNLSRIEPGTRPDSIVVLAAPVRSGTFDLPWEKVQPVIDPLVMSAVAAAAAAEFRGQPDSAAAQYRAALTRARNDAERALIVLHQARNLAARGQVAPATDLYRQLLESPLDLRDDEGIPFAVYAADRLGERIAVSDLTTFSPVALYALRAHVTPLDSARILEQINDNEQLLALRRDLNALLAATRQQGRSWFVSGPSAWLVHADSTRVIVARSAPLLRESGLQLLDSPAGDAEPLGPAFPGLYGQLANSADEETPSQGVLLIILLLTIGLGAASAAIAWRDVRRETRAAELRTQFVNSVSHELKTPLTAIRMYAELLRMGVGEAGAKRDDYIDTIIGESERLSRLINNVLDFSRLERGELTYQRGQLDLRQLVLQVQRAMSYPLQQAGFSLKVRVDADVPPVPGDADALAQAVLNLLSNAVKFSADQRTIELNVLRQNGHAVIEVRDQGRGISGAARPHLFEKFYRAPDVIAEGVPGTGLGLALVAHVAHGHGGEVQVESEPGRGSTFSIRLPIRPA